MSLTARDGYRLWAPSYDAETVVSTLEEQLVGSLGVPTAGRRLLDVGCGTARRLHRASAAIRVGIDLTPEMLAQSRVRGESDSPLLSAGDAALLPVRDEAFDVVWCRLVLGHLERIDALYAELGRVTAPGGVVVLTDFHSDAWAAGHRRTFRDGNRVVHEIAHYPHSVEQQRTVAERAGLTLKTRHDAVVGESVRSLYEKARRLDAYETQRGLALVLGLVFRK